MKAWFLPLLLLSASFGQQTQPAPTTQAPPPSYQSAKPKAATPQPQQPATLSNNNHYVNSSGNVVHSPAKTSNGSVPAGASAQCRDGSYSFSQHRSGTCSGHGGVSRWL